MPTHIGELSRNVAVMSALSRNGFLPPRGPVGSLQNSFRAAAVQNARRLLAREYGGDIDRFVADLDRVGQRPTT